VLSTISRAQTVIRGTVKDVRQNKGIESVNVMIQDPDKPAILGFTMTDKDGKYTLEYKGTNDSVGVSVSGFNIQKQSKIVARKNQTVDFTVDFESIALKEVKITPPKIKQKGDTIDYLVDGFMDKNDRTIGDVLKKLPGIDVEESGQIRYQSIPINKFYIEGLDLLQGRYGIATQNIEAKNVQSVQILENHQAIKALKDRVLSEQAAINLKLKESAKGTLTSNALIGAGFSPPLWLGEITGMYFTKGRQNITTYKGNNTGNDVSAEQRMFYSLESEQLSEGGLLSIQTPSSPSIRQKRYLFNQANAFAFNNLWKISNEYQIHANINYLNDRIDKSSFARTDYYLPGNELLKIEETLNSRSWVNRADADVQLNVNKDKFYLNNSLKFKGGWGEERGNAIGADTVGQQLEKPDYAISNTFEIIKNKGKTSLRISSFNGYATLPHVLTVQPLLYENLFEQPENIKAMRQTTTQSRFNSNNSISGGYERGNLHQDYLLSFRADLRQLDSELFPERQAISGTMGSVPDSLRNDLQWNKLEGIFSPQYTCHYDDCRLNISLPLHYSDLSINDSPTQQKKNYQRLHFNPSLGIQWKLSAYWDFFASAKYSRGLGGINNEYTGYIMRSYRNLVRNEGDLYETETQNYTAYLNYRNPVRSLFGNVNFNHFNTKANLLYGYDFDGILQVQQSLAFPNHTKGVTIRFSANQTIDAIASTVRLSGSNTNSQSSRLTQGEVMQFDGQLYSVTPGITTRIQSWAGFSYRFDCTESRTKIKGDNEKHPPIRTVMQNVQLNFFPLKGLTVNLSYEYFHNSAIVSGSRTLSFGDIGVKYKWEKLEFLLDYTNIFNAKQYISASYSDIHSYYYAYALRPAEVLLKIRFKLK
jgi:hypothetical protein